MAAKGIRERIRVRSVDCVGGDSQTGVWGWEENDRVLENEPARVNAEDRWKNHRHAAIRTRQTVAREVNAAVSAQIHERLRIVVEQMIRGRARADSIVENAVRVAD